MKTGRTLCQVFTEELWTMSDEYDDAIVWFDWWLAVQRNGYTPRSSEMCDACQRHNAWMAAEGAIKHGEWSWGAGGEAVAVVAARAPVQSAQAIAELWEGSEKHRTIIRSWGAQYGFAMYWHQDRVYATFRTS